MADAKVDVPKDCTVSSYMKRPAGCHRSQKSEAYSGTQRNRSVSEYLADAHQISRRCESEVSHTLFVTVDKMSKVGTNTMEIWRRRGGVTRYGLSSGALESEDQSSGPFCPRSLILMDGILHSAFSLLYSHSTRQPLGFHR